MNDASLERRLSLRGHGTDLTMLEPCRDLVAEHVELQTAVEAAEPWLDDTLGELRRALPVPKSTRAYAAAPFYRPPGSHRSFYFAPGTFTPPAATNMRAVVAIKGLEPLAPDFDVLLRDLQQTRATTSSHDVAAHLVFEERKIPGCLSLQDATREASRAAAIQVAHIVAYGSAAPLPLPLLVLRHRDKTVQRVEAQFRELLSPPAFDAVRGRLEAGLGVYLYHYPTPPIRVRDIDSLLGRLPFRQRVMALLAKVGDPDLIVRRWVQGFVRMLLLGQLPGTLTSVRTGICCQPQNACIDGGFVDLDSLTPIEDLRSDADVDLALHFSYESLLATVRTLLLGGTSSDPTADLRSRHDLYHLHQHLHAMIQSTLKTEVRPTLELDPRIGRYFAPATTFAELIPRLALGNTPGPDDGPPGAEVRALIPALIQAARDG